MVSCTLPFFKYTQNNQLVRNPQTVVNLRHTTSEYTRNVVALGEMEHKTAGLFEPEG